MVMLSGNKGSGLLMLLKTAISKRDDGKEGVQCGLKTEMKREFN